MSKPQPIGRMTFGQLCVIEREQIQAEPAIDDSEWKARIKDRLITLRFESPPHTEVISRAMAAVERALEKQWGPRPVQFPPLRPSAPTTPSPPPESPPEARSRFPRQSSAGFTSIAVIAKNLQDSSSSDASCRRSPEEHEALLRQQIQEWKVAQPSPRHRKTAKGWIAIDT